MNISKIRKALMAAGTAAVGVLFTAITTKAPDSSEGWAALIGAAVGAGVLAGYATWRVPNEKPAEVRSYGAR
jgi:hypothetical protein